ncbi:MAG: hypothetical protein A4E52_01761 [Pelotomaculum sp. PtaB.Bin013]|nr:MAG: hypothetical protein A4E52_01761 [Pelotomaculum sp. PtaB.Bin013]
MRTLKTFIAHIITSGFKGSPTLVMCLNFRLYFLTASSPAAANILKAVGALYQLVTPYFSRVAYQSSALKRPPLMIVALPTSQGPQTEYETPVIQPGSAVHQNTSPS